MNKGQQALLLIDGDLLPDIEARIKQGYFDEWQASNLLEDREAIHAKNGALEAVIFEIQQQAKKVIEANGSD